MEKGLFKGKRIDNGEWAEGSLITPSSDSHNCEIHAWKEKQRYIMEREIVSVFDETVCHQIPDFEDNEGDKVFTNDTMNIHYFGEIKEGVVVFDDRKLRYSLDISEKRDFSLLVPLCEVSGIVTGNIHDKK
jgi:hypothetical protein